jgi:multidrug efflux pump subunit AcrB
MSFLQRFLANHVLANLTFSLILVIGGFSYLQMPRAKDPEINFNWISIFTFYPGAAAEDVEKRITDPIEDALRSSIKDIKFVSSTSREGISNILVRFNQISDDEFDKRLTDLRREVQNTYSSELPEESEDPVVYEITTSNAFPSATVVVTSAGNDENLRRQVRNITKDLELINGVDRINDLGVDEPELHITFIPERLEGLGIVPGDLSDTVRAYFRDVSAGDIKTDDGQWIIRVEGTSADPGSLAKYPVTTARGIVPLGELAEFTRTTEEATEIVRFNDEPAALLAITKQANTNVLELVDEVRAYIDERNRYSTNTGVNIYLVDDQTISTRNALSLMQTNAIIGLLMVLLVTWLFLGSRIAVLTSIGIPFTLAGTFLILNIMDISLNNTVLLGVVIALGMLVDDAVVVVESIYQRLQRGMAPMRAALDALQEVFAPVTTSVMTTMAAFLPLMLMPGILGDFMMVIPMVVTLALAVSLLEAYWMLPAHVIAANIDLTNPSRTQQRRERFTHWIRYSYIKLLLKALRYPVISITTVLSVFTLAALIVAGGHIRLNFFEGDELRLFYVNIEMPRGATLNDTSEMLLNVQERALEVIRPHELRSLVTYAGQQFTATEPLFGDTVGQIMISLVPDENGSRTVEEISEVVTEAVFGFPGTLNVSLLRMKDGPPTSRPINVKIRGDEITEIKSAATALTNFVQSNPLFSDVTLDDRPGNPELVLSFDGDAIQRAGISPSVVSRSIQSFVDGEIVTDFQDQGEKVKVRVQAKQDEWGDVENLLRQTIALPDGRSVALGELVDAERGLGINNIRHYNYRKTITLEADIDKDKIDTVQANDLIAEEWKRLQKDHPTIDLDFTGILDDIKTSLDALIVLFLFGVGIMYIVLGTQFRSYWQPLMILVSIPLAFTGVVLGLLVTNNPLSLYTLYGVVALAGISVNAAIVLISAANTRLENGMSLLHATVYAARRRVIPVLITSLTTIAGLFSLATGLAGTSLIWGPVATAIVWGLAFSTVLTLFVIPMLYRLFMKFSDRVAVPRRQF